MLRRGAGLLFGEAGIQTPRADEQVDNDRAPAVGQLQAAEVVDPERAENADQPVEAAERLRAGALRAIRAFQAEITQRRAGENVDEVAATENASARRRGAQCGGDARHELAEHADSGLRQTGIT